MTQEKCQCGAVNPCDEGQELFKGEICSSGYASCYSPKILTLNVKKEYFDQIKSGEKTEEYRRTIPYWFKRIDGKTFDFVEIVLGYPKAGDANKRLRFPWRGYGIRMIRHPVFGNVPTEVYAVRLERDDR